MTTRRSTRRAASKAVKKAARDLGYLHPDAAKRTIRLIGKVFGKKLRTK